MCHHDHGGVLEAVLDEALNDLFGDNINVGSSFIQDDNLVTSDDGTADANKLPLARAQVVATSLDLEVENGLDAQLILRGGGSGILQIKHEVQLLLLFFLLFLSFHDQFDKASLLEKVNDFIVGVDAFWVHVRPECSIEKYRVLWNDGQRVSDLFQTDLADINSIDKDLTACDLDYTCECKACR